MQMLTEAQRQEWQRDGFFIIERFAPAVTCRAMLDRVVELARAANGGGLVGNAYVMPEAKPNPHAVNPEDRVSKVFRLHRDPVFRAFVESDELLDVVGGILGPELDCFLSQFIFKNPGAMGQPWHQDALYFPFDRSPQIGVWLAVSDATPANGCLHVLPGSHNEPVHPHVPDARPQANYGYMEIVDHDLTAAIPVLMQAGDLLVFHSHLMHRSTDNLSNGIRAAMVYHYAQAGTRDLSREPAAVNDWMPVRRLNATEEIRHDRG